MNKYQKNAFKYAAIVAMGGFVFGLDAALISGTINFIVQEFSLSDWQLGTVVSAPALSVIFALPFAGVASNRLGRRKTLKIIAALYVLSALSSAIAPNYWALVAARFLGGLAFTSITLASMYIGEISPDESRGKLVAMVQINIVVGLSVAYFINYLILQGSHSGAGWVESLGIARYTWRWMMGAEILPALIWFGLLFSIPQSPYWLLYKGRQKEAEETLEKLIPTSEVEGKVNMMHDSLKEGGDDRSIGTQVKEIFSRSNRIIFIVAATFAIAQQITGINAVLFYAPTVIEQMGIGTDAAFQQAIWIGLISVVFTVLALFLIDRVGRRPLVLGGMLWIIASLGICSWGFNSARYQLSAESIAQMEDFPSPERLQPLVGEEYPNDIAYKDTLKRVLGEEDARNYSSMLLQKATKMNSILVFVGILSFIAAFQFSVGPTMWVLFSEIFPISIRGVAIPFFALITSLTSYLVQQFFPWQLSTMGASAIFFFYASIVAIGFVILLRYLPETRNLGIEEIQQKLSR